jgi:hypothetical protein
LRARQASPHNEKKRRKKEGRRLGKEKIPAGSINIPAQTHS